MGSSLVLSLFQLLFQRCHPFSEADVVCRRLLHTRHEAAHAAVIEEMELPCDTFRRFSGQAPGYSIRNVRDF